MPMQGPHLRIADRKLTNDVLHSNFQARRRIILMIIIIKKGAAACQTQHAGVSATLFTIKSQCNETFMNN